MSDLVPAADIERIVGAERRRQQHVGRAISSEQTVYVLHSAVCIASGQDLRDFAFSVALDAGIRPDDWDGREDEPVILGIRDGHLVPVPPVELRRWPRTPELRSSGWSNIPDSTGGPR